MDELCGGLPGAAREMRCEDRPEIDATHTPSRGGLTKNGGRAKRAEALSFQHCITGKVLGMMGMVKRDGV